MVHEAQVQVGAAFVTGAQALHLVEPGEAALDDPPLLAKSGAVGGTPAGDLGVDAAARSWWP